MHDRQLRTLVSIHDLMPETFPQCTGIIEDLTARGIAPLTLLVVPGRDWQAHQIERLRGWTEAGHELAAHGWNHHVRHIRGWRHRLHSWCISRRVAEHLELRSAAILRLLQRSKAWFELQSLPPPSLYVPPAWALGPISSAHLQQAPFARIETLRGLCDPRTGRWQPLPLIGFQADSCLRALALRLWNRRQMRRALCGDNLPLRVAIHPNDLHLRLGRELVEVLSRPQRFERYSQPAGISAAQ